MAASISPAKAQPSSREHIPLDEQVGDQPDERGGNAAGRTTTGAGEPAHAKPPILEAPPPAGIVVGPAPTKMAELTPGPTPPASPVGTAPNQAPTMKKPAPRHKVAGTTGPRGAHGVRYVVQLSSERAEAAAQATSQLLETKYRTVFGGRKLFIRRADLGDRGVYYRVQVGPFAIGKANQICGNLKKSNVDCVVQRN